MKEKRLLIITGVPVSLAPEWKMDYSTYKKFPCPKCQKDMWLGQRMQKMMEEKPEIPVMCMLCAAMELQKIGQDEPDFINLTDHYGK